jgi:hypothetical protein
MPPLVRLYIKTSFAYFVAGFVLLALILLDRWLDVGPWLKAVEASQVHLLVVGWITQLSVGVAYWMFPRLRKEDGPRPRGSNALAWVVYLCLNAGLLLRLGADPFYLMTGQSWLAALVALAGLLQAAAAVGFGWLIWARIRPMEPR